MPAVNAVMPIGASPDATASPIVCADVECRRLTSRFSSAKKPLARPM